MPTLMQELASAPPTNHLCQKLRYSSTPATATPQSFILIVTILMLPPHPHDFPPILPPHIHPHPSLRFHTPSAYHPPAPAAPS
ncbi:hypothetical protein O181_094525 [Austropuccinia psidii MF-1]|uniref:Uncharacterized protein n=1 Tax=Austropuccinia psidii MF-1 TaxID=1389203 RepID=A0A9Q3PB58_9BASI|nr:hypothetical protein [Austropuccinia psidii MF-1]